MNPNAAIAIFLACSTGVLSAGQTWVLAARPPRIVRYAVVWLACSGLIGIAGRYVLWETKPDKTGVGDKTVLIAAAIIGALVLLVVAWKAKRLKPGLSSFQIARELVAAHYLQRSARAPSAPVTTATSHPRPARRRPNTMRAPAGRLKFLSPIVITSVTFLPP